MKISLDMLNKYMRYVFIVFIILSTDTTIIGFRPGLWKILKINESILENSFIMCTQSSFFRVIFSINRRLLGSNSE